MQYGHLINRFEHCFEQKQTSRFKTFKRRKKNPKKKKKENQEEDWP